MTEQTQEAPKNVPKLKFKNGAFNTSVFENTGKDKNDKEFSYDSIVMQRGYNKGTEEKADWVNEKINLRVGDIPKAISLLQKTYNELTVKKVE